MGYQIDAIDEFGLQPCQPFILHQQGLDLVLAKLGYLLLALSFKGLFKVFLDDFQLYFLLKEFR